MIVRTRYLPGRVAEEHGDLCEDLILPEESVAGVASAIILS